MESIRVEFEFRRFRNALILLLGVLLLTTAAAPSCRAQTFAEWFKQKKTQKKYLLEQIAALQIYIGYAKKGYELVGSGIQTIRDISSGEFSLHNAFVTGLKKVNPVIRDDIRVAEILEMQVEILSGFSRLKGLSGLRPDQLVYLASVSGAVMAECLADLEELALVISSGKVEMKDDERLSRINGIYSRMTDRSSFSQYFSGQFSQLIRQQRLEVETIENLRRMYGIN